MQAKRQGIDMREVYSEWDTHLQFCSLGSINHGIEVSKGDEHPPSLGRFLQNCQTYKPPLIKDRLPNLHVKDTAAGMERINSIKEMLARKMTAPTK